jgi:hypothetical protein
MDAALIEAESERLDDLVGKWHQGGSGVSLPEFLGMTQSQYEFWLKDPDAYCKTRLLREERRMRAAEQSLAVMSRVVANFPLCERVLRVLDIPLDEVEAIFGNAGISMDRYQG